jgi:hypothetical protein
MNRSRSATDNGSVRQADLISAGSRRHFGDARNYRLHGLPAVAWWMEMA